MKRFEDKDRPRCVCYDCNKPYKDFADMIIPDEDWEKINPTFHEGAGILCATCIANRLNSIGEWYKYKLVKVG